MSNGKPQIQADKETGAVLVRPKNAPEVDDMSKDLLNGDLIDEAKSQLENFEDRLAHLSSMSNVFDDDLDAPLDPARGAKNQDSQVFDEDSDPMIGGLSEEEDFGEEFTDDPVIGGLDEDADLVAEGIGEDFSVDETAGMEDFSGFDDVEFGDDESVAGFDELPGDDFDAEAAEAAFEDFDDGLDANAHAFEMADATDIEMNEEASDAAQAIAEADDDTFFDDGMEMLNEAGAEIVEDDMASDLELPGADQPIEDMLATADTADERDVDFDVAAFGEEGFGSLESDEGDDNDLSASDDISASSDSSFDDMPVPDWANTNDGFGIPSANPLDEAEQANDPEVSSGEEDDLTVWNNEDFPDAGGEEGLFDDDFSLKKPSGMSVDSLEGNVTEDDMSKDVDFDNVDVFKTMEDSETPPHTAQADDYRDIEVDELEDGTDITSVLEEGDNSVSEKSKREKNTDWLDDEPIDVPDQDMSDPEALDDEEAGGDAKKVKSAKGGRRSLLYVAAGMVSAAAIVAGGYAYFGKYTTGTPVAQVSNFAAPAPAPSVAPAPAPAPVPPVGAETGALQLPVPSPAPETAPVSSQNPVPADHVAPQTDAGDPLDDGARVTFEMPDAEVRDIPLGTPVVPDEVMDPPLEELQIDDEETGALDLSEFRMESIPEPGEIDINDDGLHTPEGEDLVETLAQAAGNDLDDLFLDVEQEEVAQPAFDESVLADYAKADSVNEVREAIDLLYERIEDMSAGLAEKDAKISDLEQSLATATAQAKRAETLALGQNEVLAEFIRVKDKVDMAENLIVDLSQRLAKLETNDPADRVEVDRSIKALKDQMETMSRDIGLIARVAINGSTGASVATAPATKSVPGSEAVYEKSPQPIPRPGDKAQVPSDVQVGDFVEGYGYVLQIMPTSDGSKVVVMENSSVIID